jgi:hypothetical protein
MLNTGEIYLHKILEINIKYSSVFCVNKSSHSAQHTVYSSVFCVNKSSHSVQHTVFLSILFKWLLLVEHCGNIYLHKILGNTLCWTLGKFIYTKYWGLLYVEHWEDLFTQNSEEYCMLNTVGRFIYTKYRGKMYVWALWEDLFKQNTEEYCMCIPQYFE